MISIRRRPIAPCALALLALVAALGALPPHAAIAAPAAVKAQDGAPDLPMPPIGPRLVSSFDVASREGVHYRVFISKPSAKAPAAGYPVLYVLDGNAWTGVAGEIARVFEYGAGPTLVVGIGYPTKSLWAPRQREFDTTMESKTPPDQPNWKTGGADKFLEFITATVKPQIEARFHIDRSRQALFGHSLNGLFVLHVLFTKPDAFTTLIAASPSIWWGDFAILQQQQAFESKPLPATVPYVLLTVGSKEGTFERSEKMRAALLAHPEILGGHSADELMDMYEKLALSYRVVDAAREMAERLNAQGVPAHFITYQDEEHNTEAPMAITRALEALLMPGE